MVDCVLQVGPLSLEPVEARPDLGVLVGGEGVDRTDVVEAATQGRQPARCRWLCVGRGGEPRRGRERESALQPVLIEVRAVVS